MPVGESSRLNFEGAEHFNILVSPVLVTSEDSLETPMQGYIF